MHLLLAFCSQILEEKNKELAAKKKPSKGKKA